MDFGTTGLTARIRTQTRRVHRSPKLACASELNLPRMPREGAVTFDVLHKRLKKRKDDP